MENVEEMKEKRMGQRTGRRGGSGPLSAPLTRARNGSPISDFSHPRTQKTTFFSTCLCLRSPHTNTPGHLARLHSFAVEFPTEIRKSFGKAAAAGRALREAEQFRGNLNAQVGRVSFVRFGAWRPKKSPPCFPLGSKSLEKFSWDGHSGRERLRDGESWTDRQLRGGGHSEGRSARAGRPCSLAAPSAQADTPVHHTRSGCAWSWSSPAGKVCAGVGVRREFERAREALRTERITPGQGRYSSI